MKLDIEKVKWQIKLYNFQMKNMKNIYIFFFEIAYYKLC
jgi:hypothetical protein